MLLLLAKTIVAKSDTRSYGLREILVGDEDRDVALLQFAAGPI